MDVLTPEGDGWHVRQIKGFTGRMTSGRKAKVKKAYSQLLKEPRLDKPIKRWSLIVPIDPTSGEQRWFEGLTADAPFMCEWLGEVYWHGRAAAHPHVIDYYLRDGRSRVEERAQALLRAAEAPAGPLTPQDVGGHLEALRALLNRDDPHYRYEFMTGTASDESLPPPPGTAIAVTRSIEGGGSLTIFVIARHRYATEDSPIEARMRITVVDRTRGIDIREAFERFQTFGASLDLPEGTLDIEVSAPAGLGAKVEGVAGRIVPLDAPGPPRRTRFRLVHPDNGPVVELGLKTVAVTQGPLGGVQFTATDDAELIDVVFRIPPRSDDQSRELNFRATLNRLSGRPVQEVLPVAQLVAGLAPPHTLEWLTEYGNQVLASYPFEDDHSLTSLGFVRFLENLSVVQNHVRTLVTVPSDIDDETVRGVAHVAHLFRQGEVRRTWTDITLRLSEVGSRDDVITTMSRPGALAVESSWALELEGRTHDLGLRHVIVASARLADVQPDTESVRLVPGEDKSMIERVGPLPREAN